MRPNLDRLAQIGVLLFWIGFTLVTLADETNPYQSIVERNAFGLREPPPPPPPPALPAPPTPPAPAVKLTGITSILNSTKALFEVQDPGPGKTPRKPILAAGERDENLEVVSIDVEKNEVAIKIAGVLTNITFSKVETASAGPAPGRAAPNVRSFPPRGVVPHPPGGSASSGLNAPTIVSKYGNGSSSSRSTVTVLGGSGGPAVTPAAGSSPAPTYNPANRMRSIPSRTVRTDSTAATGTAPLMSREELKNHLLLQKVQNPSLPIPGLSPQEVQGVHNFLQNPQ
jgi:hypothetical protein